MEFDETNTMAQVDSSPHVEPFQNHNTRLVRYIIYGAILISFVAILGLFLNSANIGSRYFDGYPIDGYFQTYHPLQRMLEGQIPGSDFPVFTGIGLPYLLFIPFYLLGGNFAASQFAVIFVTGFLFVFLNMWFLKTFQFSLLFSIGYASLLTLYALQNYALSPLVTPGNDNLGLRSSSVIVSAALLYLINVKWPGRIYLVEILSAVVIGSSIVYSTEYGLAALVAYLSLKWLFGFRARLTSRVTSTLVFLLFSGLSCFVWFSILTLGHPFGAMHYAFIDVPQDQFWYFGGPPNGFVHDLGFYLQLPKFVYLSILETIFFLVLFIVKGNKAALVLSFALLTSLIAGVVSSLGISSITYFFPLKRVMLLTFPFVVTMTWEVIKMNKDVKLGKIPLITQSFSRYSKLILSLVTAGFTLSYVAPSLYANNQSIIANSSSDSYRYSGKLGLALGGLYAGTFRMAQIIKGDPSTTNYKGPLVFSTYATALEIMLHQEQPTGFDYIIHVLGDKNRHNYLREFESSPALYVTTIRPSFTVYEMWLRMTNWPFYRYLYLHYVPVYQSAYQTLWKRSNVSKHLAMNHREVKATLGTNGTSWMIYSIDTSHLKSDAILNVTLHYHVSYAPFKIPFFSKLSRVIVQPMNSGEDFPVAIPAFKNSFSFPVYYKRGDAPLKLSVYILPSLGAHIKTFGCDISVTPISPTLLLQ